MHLLVVLIALTFEVVNHVEAGAVHVDNVVVNVRHPMVFQVASVVSKMVDLSRFEPLFELLQIRSSLLLLIFTVLVN